MPNRDNSATTSLRSSVGGSPLPSPAMTGGKPDDSYFETTEYY